MTFTHNNQTYELILLHLAGSKLYGNSTPQSDTDYRGIFIAPKETKLGILGAVEQLEGIDVYKSLKKAGLELEETQDIVIYEISRFAKLAADNNPNIFDTLCVDYMNPKYIVYVEDRGRELIDNRNLFMSSRLKFTFSGYAISQLAKIKNRDKYLTKYPDVSNVLKEVKECYDNKFIDFTWICDNFGGVVADFITGESPQDNKKLEKCISWELFKNLVEEGRNIIGLKRIANIDMYRIPQLLSYCHAKDLCGAKYNLHEFTTNLLPDLFTLKSDDMSLSKFLQTKASFRLFSPSMLAIYTEGTGIFTSNGKLKSAEPEHIGDFVCLLSIDQMKYKADRDFNAAMWEWKCKRNETRSAMEAEFGIDLKNLSHLWRLMTKAKEIMITGDYNPELVGEELETLRGVRDGSLYGKDSYDFAIKFAEENDNKLNELYKTTPLPKKADMVGINKLVLKLQGI
jgi:hypothetical protein